MPGNRPHYGQALAFNTILRHPKKLRPQSVTSRMHSRAVTSSSALEMDEAVGLVSGVKSRQRWLFYAYEGPEGLLRTFGERLGAGASYEPAVPCGCGARPRLAGHVIRQGLPQRC